MHLVLSRVKEEDFDELLEVQFRSFVKVDVHEALFGPNDKRHRDLVKARFIKEMKEDPADCWLKLVDKSTNKIVSGAQWKIYPSWAPLPEHSPLKADWHDAEEDQKIAEGIIKDFMEKRAKRMHNHAHVLLYILFTDPSYQKTGAGSIHVKWGTDLADRLLVPAWVEGSPEGHHLYESNGFKNVEYVNEKTKKWLVEYTVMKREPKTHFDAGRSVVFS